LVQSDDASPAQSFRTATKLDRPQRPHNHTRANRFGFRCPGNHDQKLTNAFKLETGRSTMAPKSKTNFRDEKATLTDTCQ